MNKKTEFVGSVYRYRLKLTKAQSDIIDKWMKTTCYLQNKTLRYYINDHNIANINYLGYLSAAYPKWYSIWETWNKEVLHEEATRYIRSIEKKKNTILSQEDQDTIIKKFKDNWRIKQIPHVYYYYGSPVKHQGGGETSTYQYYTWLKDNEPSQDIKNELNDVPSTVSQEALSRVHSAYASFYRGGGFPKFRKINDSISWSNSPPYTSIRVEDNTIHLPKLGTLKYIRHRDPPYNGIIKKANITRINTGKYYLNIFYAHPVLPTAHPEETVGFDRNIRIESEGGSERRNYATGYDGTGCVYIKQPTFYRDEREALKKAQRKVSKLRLGSREWKRAQHIVNKIQERINNRKNNWSHEQTRSLANNYKCVILEDLSIKDMTNKEKGKRKAANKKTSSQENVVLTQEKAIRRGFNETAHYKFESNLAYKLKWNNGTLIKVDPAYTTKMCSGCGVINYAVTQDVVSWTCPGCGAKHNRDENAAVNIFNAGVKEKEYIV